MKSPATLILLICMLVPGNRPERTLSQTIQGDQVRTLTTWSHAIPDSVGVFYSPVSGHFRLRYELDTESRSSRSWKRRLGWVQAFYQGNVLSRRKWCRNRLRDRAPSRLIDGLSPHGVLQVDSHRVRFLDRPAIRQRPVRDLTGGRDHDLSRVGGRIVNVCPRGRKGCGGASPPRGAMAWHVTATARAGFRDPW